MSIFSTERPNSLWSYLIDEHRLAASLGWQRLFRQPYQTLGAVLLMTLSLSLLTLFGLSWAQAKKWQRSVDWTPQVFIYPQNYATADQIKSIAHILEENNALKKCEHHSAQEVFSDWRHSEALDQYAQKLPTRFTAEYPLNLSLKEVMELKSSLENIPSVDKVDIDMIGHAQRTHLLRFSKTAILFLGVTLLSSVIIIINYSIKLFMDRYQQEIAILYHLGASTDFIQRPYLYQGFFLGALGSLGTAGVLYALQFFWEPKLKNLMDLYEYSWSITSHDYQVIVFSLFGVVVFSVISALITTHKWLSLFEHERLG